MARMKIEFLAHYRKQHGTPLGDRVVAALPRAAHRAGPLRRLANLRDRIPGLARMLERSTGFTAKRPLPRWHARPFREPAAKTSARSTTAPASAGRVTRPKHGEVVLLVDTFNRYFEADVARAAERVLVAAGYDVAFPRASDGTKGTEAERTITALAPYAERGVPIVGLEPSCLLTLRDEFLALVPTDAARAVASQALLLEEFIARELDAGRWSPPLRSLGKRAVVHGHCHQKAFGAMPAVVRAGLEASVIESSCCGMAGMFGYEAEHYDISMRMAERDLLPAVRAADADALVVADGMSCKHQIAHGAQRRSLHVAEVYASALESPT
jgi:Fe-S oxidoreductase